MPYGDPRRANGESLASVAQENSVHVVCCRTFSGSYGGLQAKLHQHASSNLRASCHTAGRALLRRRLGYLSVLCSRHFDAPKAGKTLPSHDAPTQRNRPIQEATSRLRGVRGSTFLIVSVSVAGWI